MSTTIDVAASELADWLRARGAERLWSIDGEARLEESLALPCSGAELADELARRGGRLRLALGARPDQTATEALGQLSALADRGEHEIVLRVSWLAPERQEEEWTLMTDVLAEEAAKAAQAS